MVRCVDIIGIPHKSHVGRAGFATARSDPVLCSMPCSPMAEYFRKIFVGEIFCARSDRLHKQRMWCTNMSSNAQQMAKFVGICVVFCNPRFCCDNHMVPSL